MKKRITVTIDSKIAERAKQIADERNTTVSAVFEEAMRAAPSPKFRRHKKSHPSFVQKWAGKFHVRKSSTPDPLLDALKAKYGLTDE